MATKKRRQSTGQHTLRVLINIQDTLVGLRADTNARFAETNARLDETNSRLEGVEHRLENVEGQLEESNERLERVEGRLEAIDNHLDTWDRVYLQRFDRLEARVDVLEGSVRDLSRAPR